MLTKKEKISLLEEVKRLIASGERDYICPAIEYIMSVHESRGYRYDSGSIEEYVPEMLGYRPEGITGHASPWFDHDDKESRIRIIDLTVDDIKRSMCQERGERDFRITIKK